MREYDAGRGKLLLLGIGYKLMWLSTPIRMPAIVRVLNLRLIRQLGAGAEVQLIFQS